jgi:hypothetical protein
VVLSLNGADLKFMNSVTGSAYRAKSSNILHDTILLKQFSFFKISSHLLMLVALAQPFTDDSSFNITGLPLLMPMACKEFKDIYCKNKIKILSITSVEI